MYESFSDFQLKVLPGLRICWLLMYLGPQFGNNFCILHALSFPSHWCSVKPFQVALVFVLPFVQQKMASFILITYFFFKIFFSLKSKEL